MNVRIIRSQCCGSGLCAEIAPDVFALDSKQKSTVIDSDGAEVEKLIEAAEACPCSAIIVEDDAGEQVAP
ncbi:MAG: ferredoxin [Candidatus Eisenbacteria bacterium]|nr:ferredoxin [Candidatus Eisenbacteria bacterium]